MFVPLNTIAFATLPGDLRTDGAALWTLIRNLGSSVGISLIIASLTSNITTFHSQLAEFITPFNDAMRMPDVAGQDVDRPARGLAAIEAMVTQQAAVMAYSNEFLIMTFVSLAAFPLLALIRSAKSRHRGRGGASGEGRGACGGDGLRGTAGREIRACEPVLPSAVGITRT